jgi:hypothetical protein
MSKEKLEANVCCQCGAMEWAVLSNNYEGNYRIKEDGHIEFEENLHEMQYICSKCGAWCLLGVSGTSEVLRELVKLDLMERILRTLQYIVDGTLEQPDTSPGDVLEWLEEYFAAHKGEGNVEGFISKARGIIARWKLVEEP